MSGAGSAALTLDKELVVVDPLGAANMSHNVVPPFKVRVEMACQALSHGLWCRHCFRHDRLDRT